MYSSVSLLGNTWKLKEYDEHQSLMLSQRHNISSLLAKLIHIRGIQDFEVDDFLNPDLKNNLPDPFILKDMKRSVERVLEALFSKFTLLDHHQY